MLIYIQQAHGLVPLIFLRKKFRFKILFVPSSCKDEKQMNEGTSFIHIKKIGRQGSSRCGAEVEEEKKTESVQN